MALKDTVNTMKKELAEMCKDLEKATGGNKAAAQRVRTGTIKFARTAKIYRKESISFEKGGKSTKKTAKGASKKPTAKLVKKKK